MNKRLTELNIKELDPGTYIVFDDNGYFVDSFTKGSGIYPITIMGSDEIYDESEYFLMINDSERGLYIISVQNINFINIIR